MAWVAGLSLIGGAISTVRTYRCLVRACEALSVLPSRVEYGVCVCVCVCVSVCVFVYYTQTQTHTHTHK